MTGKTDLSDVLQSLKISCDDKKYGFASVEKIMDVNDSVLGVFKEKEGITVFAEEFYFKEKNIQYEGPFAKLTIEIHTSLELVGLTAILANKLAEHNISANVVAAFFHDHIFVQYDLRDQAIDSLMSLKKS